MQVSESNEKDHNYKKRMVKGACVFAASITSARKKDDLNKLELIQTPNDIQEAIKN